MPRRLQECIPGHYKKEALQLLRRPENGNLTDKEVIAFMKRKGESVSDDIEKAKLSALAYSRLWHEVMNYKRLSKGNLIEDPAAGLRALVYTDRFEAAGRSALEAKMHAIQGMAHRKLADMILEFAPTRWSLSRNRKYQDDLVRAIFGEQNVSNKMKGFAKAWKQLNRELAERYNRTFAELDPDELPLPVETDWKLMDEVGTFENWLESIRDLLDFEAMGIAGTEPGTFHGESLRAYYQDVKTNGMSTRTMDNAQSMNSFQRRHANLRFLKFKSADAWLKYSRMYSRETPYSAMMDHVTTISREIAIRETFGPSPGHVFRTLKSSVVQVTGDRNAGDFAQKAYDNVTGALTPVKQKMADTVQSMRNVMTGTKLTGATLSALPDTVFNSMTALYNGIPAWGVIKRFAGTLIHNSKEDQKLAAQLGFILEHAIDRLHATSRFADVAGRNVTSKFAEAVMRGSGLNHWTVAGKQAFHMEFMAALARTPTKNMKRAFKRYGITDEDVAIMNASEKIKHEAGEFLDPGKLPPDLAERVIGMVMSETKYAVPEPDAAVQALMNQGLSRGTIAGELFRSGGQFKAFTVSIAMSHMARAFRGFEGSTKGRLGYAGALLLSTSMLGILSLQLKEIARGNKPRDWDSPGLVADGILAGGALSIAGDLLLSDLDRFGQSAADFLAGPLASELNKVVWKGFFGGTRDVITGEKELTELLQRAGSGAVNYVPGQFWYWRLAMDRAILDAARDAVDPTWKKRELQKERRRLRLDDTNERYWK